MKYILKIACVLLLLVGAQPLFAQTTEISGTVYDEKNQPLPGASVIILTTPNGTTTNTRGQFSLKAQKGQTIEFTFIGYKPHQMVVKDRMSALSIRMEPEANAIDEVIISVGYGQMARKDISGAVSSVKMGDLEKGVVSANFSDALAGRMAGVQVNSSEGGPGAGVDITIRGGNSITGSNAPLWVIDGFPVEDPNTFSIDTKDIEQMQVLKDASATAIYGARGANGVIIIETKKGSDNGKVTVEYNGKFTASTLPSERKFKMLKGTDYLNFSRTMTQAYSGNTKSFDDRYLVNDQWKRVSPGGDYKLNGDGKRIELTYDNAEEWEKLTIEDYNDLPWTTHDWQDEALQTAYTHSHRVGISGGNKGTRYNVSMDAFLQDGMLIKTGIDRYNIRANIQQKISKKLDFAAQVNYNATRRHGPQSSEGANFSILRDVLQYQPVNPMKYGSMGEQGMAGDFYGADENVNNQTFHPIRNLKNIYRETAIDQMTLNGTFNYQIIKPLKLMVRGGYTHFTENSDSYNNSKSRYGDIKLYPLKGINAATSTMVRDVWFNEYTLTFNKAWGMHRFNAVAGYTMDGLNMTTRANSYKLFPTDIMGMDDLSQGTPENAKTNVGEAFNMSFLGRVNYTYDDRYILTASFRADGSSKFLGKNQFGYFPSGAVAWRVSQEQFMKNIHWLTNLKLRASWGMTGNNRIGNSTVYGLLGNDANSGYMFNGIYSYGYLPSRVENRNLKWETTEQTNVGVDFSVLNDRISLTVDWYRKVTRDLLLNADLAPSSGYDSGYKNVGSVGNTGWEFVLNTVNIHHKNFRWYSSFNISFNKNEVRALNGQQPYMLTKPNWNTLFPDAQYIAQIGQPVSMIYGYIYDGIYQNEDFYTVDGNYIVKEGIPHQVGANPVKGPGRIKYRDLTGDGKIDASDMTVIGNPNPKHYGGFTNSFELYNFDFSVFLNWVYGNDILNANDALFGSLDFPRNNVLERATDFWRPENPTNSFPYPSKSNSDPYITSRSIEDGSYLRLSNITLGYTLNAKKVPFLARIGLSSLRVYFSADNLYVWTDYTGYDPEVNTNRNGSFSALVRGLDYCAYPRARTYTFGVDLKF